MKFKSNEINSEELETKEVVQEEQPNREQEKPSCKKIDLTLKTILKEISLAEVWLSSAKEHLSSLLTLLNEGDD